MDNNKLNEIIKTYVASPNYEGAIMVTAEWGAGKSFYLQNELVPFLEENDIRVIIVSLHGLRDTFEISKAIYVEYLLLNDKKKIFKNKICNTKKRKSALEHGKLAAKTIVRGVSSFFNVDLSCSKEDLKKVYDSIDLSQTLLVFEDVERSEMPVAELLAYTNNLVEYDHVKVVLITNEKELGGKDGEVYKKIKEKTVGDTILFSGDPFNAINNMMCRFNNVRIKDFFEKVNKDSTVSKTILTEIKTPINLRSILFGLEKFSEMILMVDKDLDFDYEKSILLGVLLFVHKYRQDNSIKWDTQESTSIKLGSNTYPLYKFSYDYLVSNEIDIQEILKSEKEFIEFRTLSATKNELNKRLEILYSCYIRTEKEVKDVILYIKNLLESKRLNFGLYFKIANYLFYLKPIIKFDNEINECLELMIRNVEILGEDDFDKLVFYGGIVLNDKSTEEFEEFKGKIKTIVKKNKMNPLDFTYKLTDLDEFCATAIKSRDSYYANKAFAVLVDVQKMVELIKKCSAFQINEIRGVFINIYSSSNIKEFFIDDEDNLIALREELIKLMKYKEYDSIQRYQIKMMVSNLDEIITKLQRGY